MEKRFVENPLALCSQFWNEDYSFDRTGFAENVEELMSYKQFVPYICCTAGEGYALSQDSYKELLKLFRDVTRGYELPAVAGVISTSLQEMNARVDLAEELGFDTVMFPLPGWGVMDPAEVESFMDHFLGSHPKMRFIHYNNSARSGVRLYAADYEKICEKHPNFVAVKQCYAQPIDAVMMAQKKLPLVEYYLEYMFSVANLYETPSLLPSVLCCNYNVALEYYKAGREKDFKKLAEIDAQALRASDVIGKTLPGGKIDGAYDKCFDRLHNGKLSHRLYPPYQGATEEQYQNFEAELRKALPEWF